MMGIALDTPTTFPAYTNRALDKGVFDQLMVAMKHHVEEEFKAGRIDKATYGQMYLGMMETALANSTQYLLGLLLLDEKRRGLDLANQKAEFEFETLLPLQATKMQSEIDLIDKQIDKLDKEIEFLVAKIRTEKANTESGIASDLSLIGKQITLLTAQRIGFAGNIQTKVSKAYSDWDSVLLSVMENPAQVELGDDTKDKLADAENLADTIEALT